MKAGVFLMRLMRLFSVFCVVVATAPAAIGAEPFRFALFCDGRGKVQTARCSASNSGVSPLIPLAVDHILSINATKPIGLALFPGDMIAGYLKRDASSVSACNRIQLTHWRSLMQPLIDAGITMRVTAGDHETRARKESQLSLRCGKHYKPYLPVVENFQVFRETLGEMLGNNQGPSSDFGLTYSFNMGGCHFTVLNAYTMLHHNAFSEQTFRWLESDLKNAAKEGRKTFVVSHPPVFPGSRHMWDALPFFDPTYNCENYDGRYGIDRRTEADRFWNILKKYKVVAYLCGHEHNIQVQKVEGVWHVLSGGLTEKLYPLNGVGKPENTNLILYDGRPQNPRASVLWPWNDDKKSYWGWCLISVGEDRIDMKVFGSAKRPESKDDFKQIKSFILWEK
jgi:Calcineurin-like phosphoesterase